MPTAKENATEINEKSSDVSKSNLVLKFEDVSCSSAGNLIKLGKNIRICFRVMRLDIY